jgi:hypothetical protein
MRDRSFKAATPENDSRLSGAAASFVGERDLTAFRSERGSFQAEIRPERGARAMHTPRR